MLVAPCDGVGSVAPRPNAQSKKVARHQQPEVAQHLAVAENAHANTQRKSHAEEQSQRKQREGEEREAAGDEVEAGPRDSIRENESSVAGASRVAHGARPTQLVTEKAGKTPRMNGGLDDFVAELETKSGCGNARTQFVVVSEVVGERSESSDSVQRGARKRQSGTQPKTEAAVKVARGEHAGRKVGSDAEGSSFEPDGSVCATAIERSHEANRRLLFGWSKRRQNVGEVVGSDEDVGIINDEVFAARVR